MKSKKQLLNTNVVWTAILLVILVLFYFVTNIVRSAEEKAAGTRLTQSLQRAHELQFPNGEPANETIAQLQRLHETATSFYKEESFGGYTWRTRLVSGGTDENNDNFDNFQLVRIDAKGKEVVLYERPTYYPSYDSVDWEFFNTAKTLVLNDWTGGGEGGALTSVVISDGEEKFRSFYSTYGPFKQQVTFQLPHGATHELLLNLSNPCKPIEIDYRDQDFTIQNTQVTGVTIKSKDGVSTHSLPNVQTVSCAEIDGGVQDPTFGEMVTNWHGINIELPGGKHLDIAIGKNPEDVKVEFTD